MHSQWYLIAQAFQAVLQSTATAQGVVTLVNPALPLDMGGANQALFLLMRGDKLAEQPGQRTEKRTARLVVGAAAITPGAMADADTLHFALRTALKGTALRNQLQAIERVGAVKEVELEPDLRDMAAQGSVLMSAFEIEYFQTYPNPA